MKLYHATDYSNLDSIESDGLWPTDCGDKLVDNGAETLQGNGHYGIYGWTTIEAARQWAAYEANVDTIVEFEAPDSCIINDPEFGGDAIYGPAAKFVMTTDPISARLVD